MGNFSETKDKALLDRTRIGLSKVPNAIPATREELIQMKKLKSNLNGLANITQEILDYNSRMSTEYPSIFNSIEEAVAQFILLDDYENSTVDGCLRIFKDTLGRWHMFQYYEESTAWLEVGDFLSIDYSDRELYPLSNGYLNSAGAVMPSATTGSEEEENLQYLDGITAFIGIHKLDGILFSGLIGEGGVGVYAYDSAYKPIKALITGTKNTQVTKWISPSELPANITYIRASIKNSTDDYNLKIESLSAIEHNAELIANLTKRLDTIAPTLDYIEGAFWNASDLSPLASSVLGDSRINDTYHFYLIDGNKNDGSKNIVGQLKDNNFFRFNDDTFAPTVIISDEDYDATNVELYLDNNHTQKYCDAGTFDAVSFYNVHGAAKKLYNSEGEEVYVRKPWESKENNYDIVYGTLLPHYLLDGNIYNGQRVEAKFLNEVWYGGIKSKLVNPTGICPSPATSVNSGSVKLRCMYFKVGCGSNTESSKGIGNLVTMFNRTDRAYPRTNDVSQISGMKYSRNKNSVITGSTPYSEAMMFNYMDVLTGLFTKYRTYNLHDRNLFGSGISSNDSCSDLQTYKNNGGVRYSLNGGTDWTYQKFNQSPSDIRYNSSGGNTNWSEWLSNYYPKERCLESQMALSWAVENKVPADTKFQFDGEEYSYKNVEGYDLLTSGKLIARLYKEMTEDIEAYNVSGSTQSVKVSVNLRMSVIEGLNLSGDIWCYWGGGCEAVCTILDGTNGAATNNPIKVYLEIDQSKLKYEENASKASLGTFDFENSYEYIGDSKQDGSSYQVERVPFTPIGTSKGGSISTGLCMYNWKNNYLSTTVNTRVRMGLRLRAHAHFDECSPRTWYGDYPVSSTYRNVACAFQAQLIS